MPYKDPSARLKTAVEGMRRLRIFRAALAAGNPKAIDAERERQRALNPMGPADALWAKLQAFPKGSAERQAFKDRHMAEYEILRRQGAAVNKKACRARYNALRAEVIAAAEVFS